MTTKFDRDTAVRRIAAGRYEGVVSPDWRIVRGANGGHLAAMLLRAMSAEVEEDRSPVSYTTHFARVPKETTVKLETTVERAGRTMSTVTGRMVQDGKLQIFGLAAFSEPRGGRDFQDLSMPEAPSPDDLEQAPDRPDFPFGHHFDFRAVTLTGDRAEVMVWAKMREPQPIDRFVVTQLCDAFAPSVFVKLGVGGGGAGVPTIELTVHHREPLPLEHGWLLAVFRTNTSRGGFIEEDGWLWTHDGTLVAQSRQCALLT